MNRISTTGTHGSRQNGSSRKGFFELFFLAFIVMMIFMGLVILNSLNMAENESRRQRGQEEKPTIADVIMEGPKDPKVKELEDKLKQLELEKKIKDLEKELHGN